MLKSALQYLTSTISKLIISGLLSWAWVKFKDEYEEHPVKGALVRYVQNGAPAFAILMAIWACFAVIGFVNQASTDRAAAIAKQAAIDANTITVENASVLTRQWLDDSGLVYSVKRRENPKAIFILDLTAHGRGITLSQNKEHSEYLILSAAVDYDPSLLAGLKRAPKREVMDGFRSIHSQIALAGIEYENTTPTFPSEMLLSMHIPITSDLTKDKLIESVAKIDAALSITQEELRSFK